MKKLNKEPYTQDRIKIVADGPFAKDVNVSFRGIAIPTYEVSVHYAVGEFSYAILKVPLDQVHIDTEHGK